MKRLFLAMLIVCLAGCSAWAVAINAENFPDETFRSYVSGFDTNSDGTLSDSEISAVTSISVYSMDIASLQGVEYFTALTDLLCSANQLATLDVSKNTALKTLTCGSQTLTASLDLTGDSSYPYKLGASLDISRIANPAATDSRDSTVSTKLQDGTIYLASWPSTITYNYNTGYSSTYMDVTINVGDNPYSEYQITTDTIPAGTVGTLYSQQLATNLANASWSYSGTLPEGLSLSSSGLLSGTPTSADAYSITVIASDGTYSASKSFTLTINSSGGGSGSNVKISISGDISCYVGDLVSITLGANVSEDITWSASGLPTGLDINSSTGEISGSPTTAGIYTVNITVTDGITSDTATLTITVYEQLNITSSETITGTVNTVLSFSFTANYSSVTWSISGSLPDGLSFDASTGIISGTPTVAGTYPVIITASTDDDAVSQNVTITIDIPAPNIPDSSFISYILSEFDSDNDGDISYEELASITSIYISQDMGISSLQGLEYMTSLEGLTVMNNPITELDVSQNTALIELNCANCQLTTLDVSNNTSLVNLWCYGNQLTELILGNNSSLKYLACFDNQLTTLDLSGVVNLENLNCSANLLTTLDVRPLNSLKVLTVFNNYALTELYCGNKHLLELNLGGTALTSLDLGTQKISADLNAEETGDTSYPYSINLASILTNYGIGIDVTDFISHISSIDIKDAYGAELSYSTKGGNVYFSAYPQSISYLYDTQNLTEDTYMNVSINGDAPVQDISLTLTPSTQTVTAGRTIRNISVSYNGAYDWSFSISGNTNLGLTSRDKTITGTIPSGTTARTYTVTVMLNDSARTSATATITVQAVQTPVTPVTPTGITSITLTDTTAEIPSNGGTFSTTATASGTPNGSISWTIDAPSALNATITGNGSTATISATVPANTQTEAQTYTLTVRAVDGNGVYRTGTITLNLEAMAVQEDTQPQRQNTNSYRFTMPDNLRNKLLSAFPGVSANDIHQLNDDEIVSERWTINDDDLEGISFMNERAVMTIPVIKPETSGVYIVQLNISNVDAGESIALRKISSTSSVSSSAVEDMDYKFFDEAGNEIDTVPDNKIVYAAMNLTAGEETHGVITTAVKIAEGFVTVIPVESQDTLREVIFQELSADISDDERFNAEDLIFLTVEDISDAKDPEPEVHEQAKSENKSIVGKLSTITPKETGYYVIKVEMSDELYEQINGLNVSDVEVYATDDESQISEFKASLLFGLLNTFELLTIQGKKFDHFGFKEFLMVGFLDSSQPLTLFLAKTILAIFTGGLAGCNFGLGLAGAACAVLFIIYRKRH